MEIMDINELLKKNIEFQKNAVKSAQAFLDLKPEDTLSDTLEKEVVFSINKLKLYHYKPLVAKPNRIPLLVTYALIQRYYMLDIQEDRSVLKALLEAGIDVYLIDWGYPTPEDRYVTMDDHINWYMDECVNHILKTTGLEKINLLGICQGGNFSVCYTALHQEKVNALVAMVSPIDFSEEAEKGSLLFKWGKSMNIDHLADAYGVIPTDVLNFTFLILTPFYGSIGKYIDLVNNPKIEDKAFLQNFVRMEKWVFDGPSQEAETIKQFINDLYRENKLVKGELVLGDKKVDLKKITCPLLNVCGELDNLVPNAASKPLNDYVSSKDKKYITYPVGHIGMFTGGKSAKVITPEVAKWIVERSK